MERENSGLMMPFDDILDKEGVVSLIIAHQLVLQEWVQQFFVRVGVTLQSAYCNTSDEGREGGREKG